MAARRFATRMKHSSAIARAVWPSRGESDYCFSGTGTAAAEAAAAAAAAPDAAGSVAAFAELALTGADAPLAGAAGADESPGSV